MKRYIIVDKDGDVSQRDVIDDRTLDAFDLGVITSIIDTAKKVFYVDTALDGNQIWDTIEEHNP